MRYSILCVALLILIFPDRCFTQVIDSSPVGDGSRWECFVDDLGVYLSRAGSGGEYEIAFGRPIRLTRLALRRWRRRLKQAERNQDTDGIARWQSHVELASQTLNDLKQCRSGSLPDGGGGASGNPGESPVPPDGSPCFVAGDSGSALKAAIINGSGCAVGDSPVVELMLYDQFDDLFASCTGTAVSGNAVITAAHCLVDGVAHVEVVTGNGSYSAASFHAHPNYSGEGSERYDVGVVLLNTSMDGTRTSKVLCDSDIQPGEEGIIAGYGQDDAGHYDALKAAAVLIAGLPAQYSVETDYNGGPYGNTCSGDSGGPLFLYRGSEWVLAAITSNGVLAKCGPGDQSFYASTAYAAHKQFFQQYIPGICG